VVRLTRSKTLCRASEHDERTRAALSKGNEFEKNEKNMKID